eukprot:TRINITY_DN90932_c0_g1_i1.p1 TRINITY_DN90932_c0_g1~~TRINITY_DN90932_c0_g1_i1.p1  ORF type:complete len:668 (-),score=195.74 TRINITY_DN90932_c0_g1_i1:55-2058(-)
MPSLKAKKASEADDDKRSQRKAPAPGTAEIGRVAEDILPPPCKPDRLDYSRFRGIGEDDRDERLQTGDVTWEELKSEEKQQVFAAHDQIDAMVEQKRQEEEAWKRQLKEKPSDLSWVQGRHFGSYEAFCVGRVESTLKKSGNEAFKAGDLGKAQADWEAGISMILALGALPEEAKTMLCTLRNNLAQLHIKRGEWGKVKDLTGKILEHQPSNEKALYRRAQAFFTFSLWEQCESDLEVLLKHHPENKDASLMLQQVHRKMGKDRRKLGGKAVNDIAAGLAELAPDGTVRKLRILEYGEGDPDEAAKWIQPHWLQQGAEKVVVTCQMIITSHAGEELYNSKEYRPFPETKQARDELKEYMDMVNFLDQEAKKAPRMVGDFYQKVKKRPVRWYIGDPGMYKGFDLAVRTMKPGERAVFEVDQPMLAPSVENFYESIGFHSTIAGLPQLQYYIEEERLAILSDEIPEEELDLDNKTQRGVKVELTLLGSIVFRDLSPNGDGSRLHAVLHPGLPDAPVIRRGDLVSGAFFINRPFDGSLLVQNACVEWRLGVDEGLYDKQGENKEPLRPDGGAFVPKCVGDAILKADWAELRHGALVEVRLRFGPELREVAPQYAKQFEQARRDAHKRGRKGGAMCSILVQVFPPDYRPSEEAQEGGTLIDESIPKDMEIE